MGILRVGRVVLQSASFELARDVEGISLTGMVETGLDFAEGSVVARTWRDDLKAHQREGDVVPVTWDGLAAEVNGFYRVVAVDFQTKTGYGNYAFTIGLAYAVKEGYSSSDLKFESRYTAATLTNDFSITTASEPLLAPPPHTAFDPGATMPTSMLRALSSGTNLKVYRDVPLGRSSVKWTANPADYLVGAVKIGRA